MSLDKLTLLDENTVNYINRPYKNFIINGDMSVSQRNQSVSSITSSGYYTADRWVTNISSLSAWTSSIENDAPLESGLKKSLKTTCNSSTNTIANSSFATLQYRIEGQQLQILKKGTVFTESLTLSFWVKSNLANTYIVDFVDRDNTRGISTSYAINTAGTWEKKIITIPGDTLGFLDNDSETSLHFNFWLSAGANFTSGTLNNQWGTIVDANRAVGQVNLAANSNNYFQITGVQLEMGINPSLFEIIPYELQLMRCQRYYYKTTPGSGGAFCGGYANSSTVAEGFIKFPMIMRTIPLTVETSGTATDYQVRYLQTSTNCTAAPVHSSSSTAEGGYVQFTTTVILNAGQGVTLRASTTNGFLAWSAELS